MGDTFQRPLVISRHRTSIIDGASEGFRSCAASAYSDVKVSIKQTLACGVRLQSDTEDRIGVVHSNSGYQNRLGFWAASS